MGIEEWSGGAEMHEDAPQASNWESLSLSSAICLFLELLCDVGCSNYLRSID